MPITKTSFYSNSTADGIPVIDAGDTAVNFATDTNTKCNPEPTSTTKHRFQATPKIQTLQDHQALSHQRFISLMAVTLTTTTAQRNANNHNKGVSHGAPPMTTQQSNNNPHEQLTYPNRVLHLASHLSTPKSHAQENKKEEMAKPRIAELQCPACRPRPQPSISATWRHHPPGICILHWELRECHMALIDACGCGLHAGHCSTAIFSLVISSFLVLVSGVLASRSVTLNVAHHLGT